MSAAIQPLSTQNAAAPGELLALPGDVLDDIVKRAAVGASCGKTAALLSVCTRFRDILRSATTFSSTSTQAYNATRLRLRDCQALSSLKLQLQPPPSPAEAHALFTGATGAASAEQLARELPQLLRLERLEVACHVGRRPPCDMRLVTALTRLSSLHLGAPFAPDMSGLWAAMSALRTLRSEVGTAPLDFAPLRQIPRLQSLTVACRPAMPPSAATVLNVGVVSALTALESLDLILQCTDLRWCEHLVALPRLTSLQVRSARPNPRSPSESDIIAGARQVAALTTLRNLKAQGLYWCPDAVALVALLPALERLDLSCAWNLTAAKLAPISRATALRHLALRLSALDDAAVAGVARCGQLTSLDLSNNAKLTTAAVTNLGPLAHRLHALSFNVPIGRCAGTAPAAAVLSAMTALERLECIGTQAVLTSILSPPSRSALRALSIGLVSAPELEAGVSDVSVEPFLPSLLHLRLRLRLPQNRPQDRRCRPAQHSNDAGISWLGRMPQLETAEVPHGLSVCGLRWLVQSAPRLRSLMMHNLPEGDVEAVVAQLRLLPALRQLVLVRESLSAPVIAAAGALQQLHTLALLGSADFSLGEFLRGLRDIARDSLDLRVVVSDCSTLLLCTQDPQIVATLADKGVELVTDQNGGLDLGKSASFSLH